jgi:hypothetical protein
MEEHFYLSNNTIGGRGKVSRTLFPYDNWVGFERSTA